MARLPAIGLLLAIPVVIAADTAAARPRGPSAAQIKAMKDNVAYGQLEVLRVQGEVAVKQQEVVKRFDENHDGRLMGQEKSRYDKYWYDVGKGVLPNPLATIAPVGKGPKHGSQIDRLNKEIARVRAEMAAKERQVYQLFDANGDGKLMGKEKSKYDEYLFEIRSGRIPNPMADIAPVGSGPEADAKSSSASK